MANPYHDEAGRFCSKGEMGEAVERVYQSMVTAPAGPAQEEAANAWFNLRNEFDAAKKEEQQPDILKLGQQIPERRANASLLGSAQATLDQRTADNFARYTLPKGAMGYGSQDERYAQVVSTTAIYVLIDRAQQSPYVTSHASAKDVRDTLEKALTTFGAAESQHALQLSLKRTQEILDKHTRDHAMASGNLQARIDVIPAIMDLETKALTTDIDDPKGEAQDYGAHAANSFVPSASTFAKEAAASFEKRVSNLNTYEIPTGLNEDSSSATTHNEVFAQAVTRSAIANVLSARSLVNEDYAPYSEVRRRLEANFTNLKNDSATQASIERSKAILKRESSMQELHEGKSAAYVDVKAALRALENKGLTEDLSSPLPNSEAGRHRTERDARQREATRSVREGRRGLSSESDEMKRLFTENPDEFYRRNRENAAAKAEASTRRPPRFIPRGEGRKPDVNGPRF